MTKRPQTSSRMGGGAGETMINVYQILKRRAPKITLYPDTKTTPKDRRFPTENSTELMRLRTDRFYLGFGFNRPSWPSAPIWFCFFLGLKNYMYPFPPCYSVALHLRFFKWEAISFSGVVEYVPYYETWRTILYLGLLGLISRFEYSSKLTTIKGL